MSWQQTRRLPHTFPHKIVFTTALFLCLCSGTTIAFGALAWSRELWGYYWWTGFWSGTVILLAAIFGVVCSFVRNTSSVKTFMIIAIFGCLVSLGMIALSIGGLNPNSGFYVGDKRETFLTFVYHVINLGVGVLQLALCVLSDGICIYYLFVERSAELYSVKQTKRKKKENQNIVRNNGKTNRISTESNAPLLRSASFSKDDKKKQKDKQKKRKSKDPQGYDVDEVFEDDMPIAYTSENCPPLSAKLLRKQEQQEHHIHRNNFARSSSFSTFGHKEGPPDRVSLIVHSPDDNASVSATTRTHTPDIQRSDSIECHYAQTLLFDPPLPIEEDDELPPYEVVDTHPYTNVPTRKGKRSKSQKVGKQKESNSIKRSKSVPSRNKKAKTAPDVNDSDTEVKQVHSGKDRTLGRSRRFYSTEILDRDLNNVMDRQGVVRRDFAHSSDRILMRDVQMRHCRPQSAKFIRDKREDRRRRAMSAEVRLTREQLMAQGAQLQPKSEMRSRTNSIDGSNPGLLASNRILPTKFSLRTPMRKIGTHVSSPVPVKPIRTTSLKSRAPPKPPRTHSVTLADLKRDEAIYAETRNNTFSRVGDRSVHTDVPKPSTDNNIRNINVQIHAVPTDQTRDSKPTTIQSKVFNKPPVPLPTEFNKPPVPLPTESNTKKFVKEPPIYAKPIINRLNESEKANSKEIVPRNSAVMSTVKPATVELTKIDNGPVLKCAPAKITIKPESQEPVMKQTDQVMTLPTSPVQMRPPKTSESVYTRIEKGQTVKMPQAVMRESFPDPVSLEENDSVFKTEESPSKSVKIVNNRGVVYANENVHVSPGKVTQRSQKLLFSFSNEDQMNVFDSSPVKGNMAMAEMVETFNVKHTVESPKDARTVNKTSPKVETVTQTSTLPLSPTEHVLQRKNLTSSLTLDYRNSSETFPTAMNRNSLKGARPKTLPKPAPKPAKRNSFKGNSDENPYDPNSPNSPSNPSTPKSSTSQSTNSPTSSRTPTKYRPSPAIRRSLTEMPKTPTSDIQTSTSSSDTHTNTAPNSPFVTVLASPTVKGPPPNSFPNRSSSASSSPVSTLNASGSSSNSQGVRHLPQSQHARHVTANEEHGPDLVNGAIVVVNMQPEPEVNNNNGVCKPLFSKVL